MPSPRANALWFAKLAEQAERYQEMVDSMKRIAFLHQDLNYEERNLFSVAYKNAIDARRASLRIVRVVIRREKEKGNYDKLPLIKRYRTVIENEVIQQCDDALDVLDKHLIPYAATGETQTFWHRMVALHHRYLAEYGPPEKRKEYLERATESYKFVTTFAASKLPTTHPVRLGVALNFSTFYYEVAKEYERACQLSKQSFDEAIAELDTLTEEGYKDATLIMQLLRDNATSWAQEIKDGIAGEDDEDD